jgi:hypothetical protein
MSDDLVSTVKKTVKATALQWGAIGVLFTTAGSSATWAFTKIDLVNTALAQAQVTTAATVDRAKVLEQRIEAVDAGTRAALDRFEKKMDDREERAQKERDEQRVMMQTLLREIKKK